MPLVTQWTGREIKAFRTAIRMSLLDFSHKLARIFHGAVVDHASAGVAADLG